MKDYIEVDGFRIRIKRSSIYDSSCIECYMDKGMSYEESIETIVRSRKEKQYKTDPRFPGYYLRRGYSLEEAEELSKKYKESRPIPLTDKTPKEERKENPKYMDYYLSRGYSKEEAISEVRRYQSINSSLVSKSYWVSLGKSEEEASKIVSDIQKKRSPLCLEHWIDKGYSYEEANNKVSELQKERVKVKSEKYTNSDYRKSSVRCIEYYIERGQSFEEAKKSVRELNDNVSEKAFRDRCGELWEEERSKYLRRMSESNSGKRNGMYGKSAPINSGYGYSGHYKSYYFRSLYEYFYMKMCEDTNIHFVCNDVSVKEFPNKIVIPIGDSRNYIPDFIEEDRVIVEIKNSFSYNKYFVKDKLPYLIRYCSDYGYSYKVLTEKDIILDYKRLVKDFNNGLVTIDFGKLERFMSKVYRVYS